MVNHPNRSKDGQRALLVHTAHKNGKADILMADGPSRGALVGHSRRSAFPLGGYIFTISTASGVPVYTGNRMSEGLDALARELQGQANR